MDSHKVCKRCNQRLPMNDFAKGGDRFGRYRWCRPCAREYRRRNRAALNESRSKWRSENRDKVLESGRRCDARRADRRRGTRNDYAKQYRLENIDAERRRKREWRRANPNKDSEARAARRSLVRGAYGFFDFQFAKDLYGHRCAICGDSESKLTVGHIIPLSRGGSNGQWNIRPECQSCNSRKHSKLDQECQWLDLLATGDWPDVE